MTLRSCCGKIALPKPNWMEFFSLIKLILHFLKSIVDSYLQEDPFSLYYPKKKI